MNEPTVVVAQRVTVNLNERASGALDALVEMTGYNKTDIINRALQMYELAERINVSGGTLHFRRTADSELERVVLT